MGSVSAFEQDPEEEVHVLVTGYQPFKDQFPVNPSWEIAHSLPEYIHCSSSSSSPPAPRIRLHVHPEAIRVSYKTVRDLVPTFWDDDDRSSSAAGKRGQKYDYALHIGMAGPPPVYAVERRSFRDGYDIKDVDGDVPDDAARREGEGEGEGAGWIWHGMPPLLYSDLDVEDTYRRWREVSPKHLDLKISDDPGRYLCGFIYYSSLAHLRRQQRPGKVLFLHVPADGSERSVETGAELAVNLVRAMVESDLGKKKGRRTRGTGSGGNETGDAAVREANGDDGKFTTAQLYDV